MIGSEKNNAGSAKDDLNEIQRFLLTIAEDQIIEKKNLTLIEEQHAPQAGSSAKFFVYKKE